MIPIKMGSFPNIPYPSNLLKFKNEAILLYRANRRTPVGASVWYRRPS